MRSALHPPVALCKHSFNSTVLHTHTHTHTHTHIHSQACKHSQRSHKCQTYSRIRDGHPPTHTVHIALKMLGGVGPARLLPYPKLENRQNGSLNFKGEREIKGRKKKFRNKLVGCSEMSHCSLKESHLIHSLSASPAFICIWETCPVIPTSCPPRGGNSYVL